MLHLVRPPVFGEAALAGAPASCTNQYSAFLPSNCAAASPLRVVLAESRAFSQVKVVFVLRVGKLGYARKISTYTYVSKTKPPNSLGLDVRACRRAGGRGQARAGVWGWGCGCLGVWVWVWVWVWV